MSTDLRHAINFRRTHYYFIDFITVLFQKQGIPQQNNIEKFIAYDLKTDNIRTLCHNYVLQQLLMRHKRGEGQLTVQDRKCNAVNADRYDLQYNP